MAPSDPADPTEDLTAARRATVGRYELRAELGSGGMGTVWRAFDPRLDRDVAIKEVHLPPDLPPRERERARARMVREARAAARVPHPSVVTVHDVLEVDGTPFIVMELLDGESLRDLLHRSGPLPEREVERIARPLLDALRAAHRSGVIHRDVKPANIMLADGGARPVLTDFGIANLADGGATALTGTGTILGTAAYAAPERLDRDETTAASDLWSLGATLFAALAGASPFKRDSLTSTLTAVLTLPVPRPPAGARLTALVGGLLERDPRRRLTSERALALLDGPGPTPPPSVSLPAHSAPAPAVHASRPSVPASPAHPVQAPAHSPVPRRSGRPLLWTGAAALVVALLIMAVAMVARLIPLGPEEGGAEPTAPATEAPAEEAAAAEEAAEPPEGFEFLDDGVVRLLLPEDWEAEDVTDEHESEVSTPLAAYDFATGVETGTASVTATDSEVLALGAYDSLLRMEEILHENADFTDVESLRLSTGPPMTGYGTAVYEVTFRHEERQVPERWMLVRELSDPEEGRSYRLTLNFPAELREEHADDFERMITSFEPVG
ncbi:serine/threonine-protein kinase [Nocardiopsis sp. Huas11]|uniref:serine/threonine-protein kinase n=1 Tax=Nocardiopsis sp. Huas11 TaxID=2183912 RepID=UPI0018F3C8A0|nr:serine/threonine-protein kinase [Nocardiopsis sp. Huas11]